MKTRTGPLQPVPAFCCHTSCRCCQPWSEKERNLCRASVSPLNTWTHLTYAAIRDTLDSAHHSREGGGKLLPTATTSTTIIIVTITTIHPLVLIFLSPLLRSAVAH